MLALLSVWTASVCLVLSATMVLWPPAFNDILLPIDLWGCCLSMCLAGLVLWSHRKDTSPEAGVRMQRLQCKVAVALSLVAAALVYALVIAAEPAPLELAV